MAGNAVGLTIPLEHARGVFVASVDAFVNAASGLDELALFAPSRCHGWSRLDVVSHVIAGWHEMLGGMVSPTGDEPTVDAASYWNAFAADYADADPVAVLMAQRRRADSYSRPRSAIAELTAVAEAVRRGAASTSDRNVTWQGHVFTCGDFFAVWAVEVLIHHLDLDLDLHGQPPPEALSLARRTIESLAGEPLPANWSDADAVLIGSGRLPVPAGEADLSAVLPALG